MAAKAQARAEKALAIEAARRDEEQRKEAARIANEMAKQREKEERLHLEQSRKAAEAAAAKGTRE